MSTVANEVGFSVEKTGRKGTAFFAARLGLALAVLGGIAVFVAAGQPRTELIAAAPFAIQVHFYAAVSAAGLGLILLAWRKGHAFHRALGWLWVYAVAVAIISSFWIRDEQGNYTWIHLSSIFHGCTLALAIMLALQRNIKWHRWMMLYTYWVGVVGAIGLAVIPGRLLWQVLFT